MELSECIAEKIRRDGPVSFRDFMESCLYDSESGFYTSRCKTIGKDGDFYTSPTLTPVFGMVLGKQLEEMWELMGCLPFTIVEYGAGTGHLCRDITTYLENNEKMYAGLRYCIIEKSRHMLEQATKQLTGKTEQYNSISEIQEINGCVLSNELVDNFAVHRVVMEQELMEVFVDYKNGFVEQLCPAEPELKAYLSELDIKLPAGYATEINLEALKWISEVASALKSGFVLTIDYGHKSPGMYKTSRSQGTLLCYHKHSVNDSFYEHIGEQDITSHVNFSALSLWGAKNGLREIGFIDQGRFLTALGFREQLLKALSGEPDTVLAAQKATSLSHTLLMDMGRKYKVLIQEKDVECSKILSGLVSCLTV